MSGLGRFQLFLDLVEILPKSFIVEKNKVKVASFFYQHRLQNDFFPSGGILFGKLGGILVGIIFGILVGIFFGILFVFFIFGTEAPEDSVCVHMTNINQSVQIDGQKSTFFSRVFHSFTHQFYDGITAEPMIIGVTTASGLGLG